MKAKKGMENVLITGCKTYGRVNLFEKHCQDPECQGCYPIQKALSKELNKFKFYEQN